MELRRICGGDDTFSLTTSMSGSGDGEQPGERDCMNLSFLCKETSASTSNHFCTRCLVAFRSRKLFDRHMKSTHRGEAELSAAQSTGHTCPICARIFSHRHNMRRHIDMVHQNRRPHHCEFCQKTFMTRSCVRRHISRRHSS
mmetsp:Transcript_5493/g.16375  ORF Transcript_5493/g.16375 Transcript_5493/m.16375 type:complete len:142 (-) Transcript_5493:230-655(-)